MKYKNIPNTDLNVSIIALGTWVFGGDFWGGSKTKDSLETVHAAIDSGINFIDTAPIYGNGRSEEIVGKAIKGKRDKVYIATKCGLRAEGKSITHDLSQKNILKEVDDSLRRLQIDVIDLYQCHWPDENTALEETAAALLKLKEEGKIRYIGISNYEGEALKQVKALINPVSLQSQYSLLERNVERNDLAYCRENEIGFLAYGALGGGILSGKYQELPDLPKADVRSFFSKFYQASSFEKTQAIVKQLKNNSQPPNQVALNWIAQQPGVSSVLVGCRNQKQLQENILAASWQLDDEQLTNLQGAALV